MMKGTTITALCAVMALAPCMAHATDDPWADFDFDGIHNLGESLAGTDPNNADTDADGIPDYDDCPVALNSTPLSYGWLYTDYDRVSDAYESNWDTTFASPFRYDEHEDRDLDGWDNWSESLAGTSLAYASYNENTNSLSATEASVINKAASFPLPDLNVTLDYHGKPIVGARLVIHAYSREDMNGWPDAVFIKDFSADTLDTWPLNVTVGTNSLVYGHLRQGRNWFYAWMDEDWSSLWSVNGGMWPTWTGSEPAAIADNQLDGIEIGFDRNEITFHLTDKAESFARFSWEGNMSEGQDVHVAMLFSGNPVFHRVIKWPRTWVHEGDVISWNNERSGLTGSNRKNFGLGALEGIVSPSDNVVRGFEVVLTPQSWFEVDQWSIGVVGVISNWMHSASALSKPVLYGPIGQEIVSDARPEFRFSLDPEFTEFQFVMKNTATDKIVCSERVLAPGRFWNDATHARDLVIFKSPICVGDVTQNGVVFERGKTYQWVVTAYSPAIRGGVSSAVGYFLTSDATGSGTVNAPSGKGVINVNVSYSSGMAYTGSTPAFICVQAFRSMSFNGPPDASVRIANAGTCTIRGLEDGQNYYLRAYIEQGGDPMSRDNWESWGYYRAGSGAANPHLPVAAKATSAGNASTPCDITIRDCDTDNDLLPDAYEWAAVGNFSSLGVANYAPSIRKTVAYAASPLVILPTTPAAFTDADGDGISDNDDMATGYVNLGSATDQTFAVAAIHPAGNDLALEWFLDGESVGTGTTYGYTRGDTNLHTLTCVASVAALEKNATSEWTIATLAISDPESVTVSYGGNAQLTADVVSSLPAEITWYDTDTGEMLGSGETLALQSVTNSRTVKAVAATSFDVVQSAVASVTVLLPTDYTVCFNPNGGSGVMADQTIPIDTNTRLRANSFTNAGFLFTGWTTNVSGNVEYADEESVYNLIAPGETIILYAVWMEDPSSAPTLTPSPVTAQPVMNYKVKFSANGGTLPKGRKMATQTMSYGKASKLRKNVFKAPKGKVFAGWAVSKANAKKGIIAYTNAQKVSSLRTDGKTTTLYAVWAKKTYKVAFYANGGTEKMAVQTFTYGKPKKLSANKFKAPKGKKFVGWAKSKADAQKGKVTYKNKAKVKNLVITGKTVKLYAVWGKK